MHYFSKIVLHKSARTQQEFTDPGRGTQAIHRLIWRAFEDQPGQERDFIFRVDVEDDAFVMWAVSKREPDDWGGRFTVDTKPYSPRIEVGQQLGFELRVHPTVTSSSPGKQRGKRHDAVMHYKAGLEPEVLESMPQEALIEKAALAWMSGQGARVGFEIQTLTTDSYVQRKFKKKPTSKHPVKLSILDLSGVLVVKDPDALIGALTGGLGSAKAYGNGLFMLSPL